MSLVESEVRRLVRISDFTGELSPWTFLRRAPGGGRGFWARGAEWIAHSGTLWSFEDQGEASGLEGDRFSRARGAAGVFRSWANTGPRGQEKGLPAPRLFGGFSFSEDHRGSGVWSHFPAARFVLPEWEVRGGPRGARVVLQALCGPGADEESLHEELSGRLALFMEALRRAPNATSGSRGESGEPRWGDGGPPPVQDAGDRELWRRAVAGVLDAIQGGSLSKVVLARSRDLPFVPEQGPLQVLARLHRTNGPTHVFYFEPEPGSAFLGAAPETVASLSGGRFHATAVAGSASRGRGAAEDREMGRRLLESPKDRREHDVTVREMVRALRPHLQTLHVDPDPRVLRLPGIQHLETRFSGRGSDGLHVLTLVQALHPTPAVCGFPRKRALEWIQEEEPFHRGWYAGPVGWFDLEGDGVFAPALRSAVCSGGVWRLFAGAGLVEGSEAEREWEETALKFQPMLRALGVGADP